MQRTTFYGIGAYIASFTGGRTCTFIANIRNGQAIDYADPAARVPLDLDKTPSAIQTGGGDWKTAEVDDRGLDGAGAKLSFNPLTFKTTEGALITTFNPFDEKDGASNGAAYISKQHFGNNRSAIVRPGEVWPPAGFKEYELVSTHYTNNMNENGERRGLRFHGFHAEVDDEVSAGGRTLLKVRVKFTNQMRGPFWIELTSLEDCDTEQVESFPMVTRKGDQGALFLRLERAARLHASPFSLRGPKLPINQG